MTTSRSQNDIKHTSSDEQVQGVVLEEEKEQVVQVQSHREGQQPSSQVEDLTG